MTNARLSLPLSLPPTLLLALWQMSNHCPQPALARLQHHLVPLVPAVPVGLGLEPGLVTRRVRQS